MPGCGLMLCSRSAGASGVGTPGVLGILRVPYPPGQDDAFGYSLAMGTLGLPGVDGTPGEA